LKKPQNLASPTTLDPGRSPVPAAMTVDSRPGKLPQKNYWENHHAFNGKINELNDHG
jgi:hypothetical protein